MLVWRKRNIKKTVSPLQYCVLSLWCTKVRAVLTGRLTGSDFDLDWFSGSSVFFEHLCTNGLHGDIYIYIYIYIQGV